MTPLFVLILRDVRPQMLLIIRKILVSCYSRPCPYPMPLSYRKSKQVDPPPKLPFCEFFFLRNHSCTCFPTKTDQNKLDIMLDTTLFYVQLTYPGPVPGVIVLVTKLRRIGRLWPELWRFFDPSQGGLKRRKICIHWNFHLHNKKFGTLGH